MATKARAKRAGTKKKTGEKSADSPFFRPFADLKPKAKKATKAEPEKSAKKEVPAKKAAGHARVPEPDEKTEKPQPSEQARPPSEAETFAMYMAGVRTLEDRSSTRIPRSANRVEKKAAPAQPLQDFDEDARAALHSLVAEGFRFEVVDDGERIEGRRVDVDPREVRRLRRGAYTTDGRVDLHGKNAAEARKEVEKFIRKRRADGDRVVAVIVGRGSHSPRGIGVLRGEIAAWLSQGPSAHHVAAFASAPEDEGGSGVVLVLLAR